MLVGGLLGGGLGVLGLSYLEAAVRHGWFDVPPIDPGGRTTLLLLAVVAAPLVEEVLFRGLLLGGLVRTVRPALAIVWSAALFTAMHPVVSWPPVFVLGVMTAWLRLRANFLPAAVLMHAIYNLVVVSCQ
jgi:membrane protease YdiL (CAAX protease family)